VQSIHAHKTASLFVLAARLPCMASGASEAEAAALVGFATDAGIAYQIVDDLQDRAEPGEARGNLVRAVGVDEAVRMARGHIDLARRASKLDAAEGLDALLDWLEQEVKAASTRP
jgi:geranylgeranyl diphosphate synthase type II